MEQKHYRPSRMNIQVILVSVPLVWVPFLEVGYQSVDFELASEELPWSSWCLIVFGCAVGLWPVTLQSLICGCLARICDIGSDGQHILMSTSHPTSNREFS